MGGGGANAAHCTTTVIAPASIQAAVDAASFSDVVCLDDSGGAFAQTVIFGSEDSGITLSAADGTSPELDGTTTAFAEAIRLLDGVTDVTIEGLDIHDYFGATCCGVGNAIQAWAVNTSNITVQNNDMHDNNYSAILVGSEGAQTHSGWSVRKNIFTDNATSFFSAQVELTNCNGCSIHRNTIAGGAIGILVQARNFETGGLVEIAGVSVKNNVVTSTPTTRESIGIYALAFGAVDPTRVALWDVSIVRNTATAERAVQVLAAFDASVNNTSIVRNSLACDGGDLEGIRLNGVAGGVVDNTKIIKNSVDASCTTPLAELNDTDDTKLPPGLNFP